MSRDFFQEIKEKSKKLKIKVYPKELPSLDPESYLLNLIQERIKESGNKLILTASASYDALDEQNLKSEAELLFETYKDIIQNHPDCVGVYTVLNVISAEDEKITHQNWIFLDIKNKKLIRFEPSTDYEEFKMEDFFKLIIKKLEDDLRIVFEYEPMLTELNKPSFHSCKTISSVLAALHIKGVDIDKIKLSEKETPPFVKILKEELDEKFHKHVIPPPANVKTRIKRKLAYVIPK